MRLWLSAALAACMLLWAAPSWAYSLTHSADWETWISDFDAADLSDAGNDLGHIGIWPGLPPDNGKIYVRAEFRGVKGFEVEVKWNPHELGTYWCGCYYPENPDPYYSYNFNDYIDPPADCLMNSCFVSSGYGELSGVIDGRVTVDDVLDCLAPGYVGDCLVSGGSSDGWWSIRTTGIAPDAHVRLIVSAAPITIGRLAVPEPDSWALLLLGFSALGMALRFERQSSSRARPEGCRGERAAGSYGLPAIAQIPGIRSLKTKTQPTF